MPLGMELGLGPGGIVLDGDLASPRKKGIDPLQFSAHVLWPNGWIDHDALCMEVGLGPSNIVLDGDPAPLNRGTAPPTFRPMSVVIKWLNVSINLKAR